MTNLVKWTQAYTINRGEYSSIVFDAMALVGGFVDVSAWKALLRLSLTPFPDPVSIWHDYSEADLTMGADGHITWDLSNTDLDALPLVTMAYNLQVAETALATDPQIIYAGTLQILPSLVQA